MKYAGMYFTDMIDASGPSAAAGAAGSPAGGAPPLAKFWAMFCAPCGNPWSGFGRACSSSGLARRPTPPWANKGVDGVETPIRQAAASTIEHAGL